MALANIPTAEATYGPIKDWCFEAMSFDSLFFLNDQSFNTDISGWDTSKISSMYQM